tara:strand:+ start:10521 stop:13010 length:2490 start_codon:yes stop_codon:yes gene_type:complete
MMTRTFASVAVMAALGLLAPIHANAFGLGKLELSSALNEPLKAEISITALKGNEADDLQVRLASSKEFEQAGIERNFLLTQLKFDVVEKSGNVKIVISSQQPIREPFLDFLLTATTTGSGRLIREYTVLLDPPKSIFNKSITQPLAQNPVKASATTSTSSVSKSKNATTAPFDSSSYGPVVRTDTLWDVALKTRPENNITVHQMMMALLKANPDAFQHENVNGLKAGYTLSIPSKNDIYKLTKQQAVAAFSEQNVLWKNRNARPIIEPVSTNNINQAKAEVLPVVDKAMTTETIAPVTDVAATDTNDTARLKLVVPNDQPSLNDEALSPLGAEKVKALSEQLTLAQETIEGQTQENIDFKSRMDALEVQMETMRRLISLKDADLARLQSMLQQDQKPSDGSTLTDDEIPVVNAGVKSESVQTAEADGELESLLAMAQKIVANNKLEMAIGAGGLLLLLVGLLIAKRRKDNDEEWEDVQSLVNDDDGLFSEQSTKLTEDKLDPARNIAEAEQADEKVVYAKKTVVELIEQADDLIADTHYEQATALLEQAKQQEPTNALVLTKLLFVMFKLQKKESFVTLARSVDIDKTSTDWVDIATWGRELAPLNTLFHIATVAKESTSGVNIDASSTVNDDEILIEPMLDKDVADLEDNSSNSIEFNLDDYAKDAPRSAVDSSTDEISEKRGQDDSLAFDSPLSLDDENKNADFDLPLNFEANVDIDDTVLSLDDEPLSLDLTEQVYEPEVLSTDDINLDTVQSSNTELDLGVEDSGFEFDINAYDEIDEAETKLDLAAAYADMGDPDGARNILEEVLKEGNDEQKSKAQALLKSLS